MSYLLIASDNLLDILPSVWRKLTLQYNIQCDHSNKAMVVGHPGNFGSLYTNIVM